MERVGLTDGKKRSLVVVEGYMSFLFYDFIIKRSL